MDSIMELSNIETMMVVVLPILMIHFSLMIFCIFKISREGVGTLNKVLWLIIVIAIQIFGSVMFLVFGRKEDDYDSYSQSKEKIR